MQTAPTSTRFAAAFAAVRITYTLLQFVAPLGGASAAPLVVEAHPAVVALATSSR
ncbi:hypothetical protein [Ideonella sp. YS5]|uniref:hypothetical protein n=1 Tax=Ideonella sp. YS5 TaxID=3453714 RepID=UPI003EEF63F2